jgi:exopolysaccharide biosynthesis polyprenyl glycosylphosphotransferase
MIFTEPKRTGFYMNRKKQVARYIIFDFLAAAVSWTLFFIYRKQVIEPLKFGYEIPVDFNTRYFLGLFIIPAVWVLFYFISGYYRNIYRRSRLIDLGQTALTTVIGVTVIFFTLLLDDTVYSYKNYYQLYFNLLVLHFGFTYLFRLILTTRTIAKIHKRKIGFNTLMIGNNDKALKIFHEMSVQPRPAGNIFVGFVSINEKGNGELEKYIPALGSIEDISEILSRYNIEEVIIALETDQHDLLSKILTIVENREIIIWGIPDLYDFLAGSVRINTIYSSPLIKISNGLMPAWQENIKRLIDVTASLLAIIIFAPVYLIIAVAIKLTSPGPVIYRQERIGKFGKPFIIYKFRSMVADSETNGPALSSKNDKRITRLGKFLRKTHLDEIPQFFNVIRGDMSLVGPRPERQHYIDQIVRYAPHYTHLHKLRPGITSWGQVKYGYASDVNEMLERLPYDMIYLKNISLYIDFKILIYTLINVFHGRGK